MSFGALLHEIKDGEIFCSSEDHEVHLSFIPFHLPPSVNLHLIQSSAILFGCVKPSTIYTQQHKSSIQSS